MKRITTGDFARALKPYYPLVSHDMVREWVVAQLLPHWRNPLNDRAWYFLKPTGIAPFLRESLGLSSRQVAAVLKKLKIEEA